MTTPTPPAEQQAQPGAVYAELHEPDATTVGLGAVWNRHSIRDFADRTHALRMQSVPKAAPWERDQAAQRLRELAGISQEDVADPLHPRYIEGYKAGHTAGSKRAAPQQEAREPVAIKAMGYGGSTGINDYLMSDGTIKAMRPSEVVWAAPQPVPAPEAIAKLRHLYQNMVNGAVRDTASAKRIAEGLLAPAIEALERATPPVEQQAAPKAAPGESDYSKKWDAELGRTAMRFVDRAGDVHPGIDDAETICTEFYKAMSEVIERMPHVQRMAAPQPVPAPLSAREIELLDGMIDAQLNHAQRCDSIPNRPMAEKQKGWDMERVTLLRKLKATMGGQQA